MKKIVYILSAALALTLSSCAGWLDVNKDPNAVTDVDNGLIIPAVELNLLNASGFYGHMFGSFFAEHYAIKPGGPQYLGLAHWDTSDATPLTANFVNYFYISAMVRVCNNAAIICSKASETESWGDYLAATVLRVYALQMLVDGLGEMPYSEAGNTAILAPKYDDGKTIYAGLVKELDDALAKVSASDKVSDNMVFESSSDVDNWIRFANALKLRILMREHGAVDVKAQLAALVSQNKFPVSDIAYAGCWANQAGLDNPVYSEVVRKRGDINTGRTIEICAHMAVTSVMNEVADPRRAAKFLPSFGHGNTWDGAFIDDQYSKEITAKYVDADTYAEVNFKYDTPVYLITVAETQFFLAEYYSSVAPDAAKAKAAYEAAIDASFATHGCTSAQAAALYAGGSKYAWNASKANELIGIQKWIHLAHVNGYESWCELRRLGYPQFNAKSGADLYKEWAKLAKSRVEAGNDNPTPLTADLVSAGLYKIGTLVTPPNVASGMPANTLVARLPYPKYSTDRNENAPERKPATEKLFWAK